jgi:hypothetical protein
MLMSKVRRIGAVALAFVMVVAIAAPVLAAGDVSVGDFVMKLAKARNLNASDVNTAVNSLNAVGVRLPAGINYTDRLTEGTVTGISRSVGLNVRTSTPDSNFDSDMVDRFFVSFASELGDNDDTVISVDFHNNGNGKDPNGKGGKFGKGKGGRTPSEPE